MISSYLAHIADEREQTILEHLQGTAVLAKQFASLFASGEQGYFCGLLHDIGKYSEAFQRRLRGGPKVDHSTAGAFETFRQGQVFVSFCIMGHHSGLPDYGGQGDLPGQSSFCGRIKKGETGDIPDYAQSWKKELTETKVPSLPSFVHKSIPSAMFYNRMLFSCLVDADYLDTEQFMSAGKVSRGCDVSIDELAGRLRSYLDEWNTPDTRLNRLRTEIRKSCEMMAENAEPGLFTLTVPTGGGKTISSLDFALRHAKAHGLSRVIYVIPYTSIIDQTAEVFRNILGSDCVLEHHSGVEWNTEDESDISNWKLIRATENWDMPVIVTTAVQFFESLYASKTSKCRKLHNIANSVIIFDEAQLLPLPYLRPCVFAISELVANYHVSAVLCTATQPVLDKIFREFNPEIQSREICPVDVASDSVFRRVRFERIGELSVGDLAEVLSRESQVLCVVNSKQHALDVFNALEKDDATFHLSTLMMPQHRKKVLEEVRRRLVHGEPCCVVSTSLIEAGVDVDFPTVYREETGLDSIMQAAGRCNREGKHPTEESRVCVFSLDTGSVRMFETAAGAFREIARRFQDWQNPEAVREYFSQYLDLKGSKALDKKNIMQIMEEKPLCFATVANRFHLIDSDTRTVYLPIGEGAELVERLRRGEYSKELFRKLSHFSVALYPQDCEVLDRAGKLEKIDNEFLILADTCLYSEKTGLFTRPEGGDAYFI